MNLSNNASIITLKDRAACAVRYAQAAAPEVYSGIKTGAGVGALRVGVTLVIGGAVMGTAAVLGAIFGGSKQ